MDVVFHAVDLKHFVFVVLKNPSDVGMQFIFPFFMDQCLAVLHRKYELNVNLCVSVGHSDRIISKLHQRYML
jgi:hypothetical protein